MLKKCLRVHKFARYLVVFPRGLQRSIRHDADVPAVDRHRLRVFADWLTAQGCKADKVAIESFEVITREGEFSRKIDGLGLAASENIEKDEIVITLPTALHLSLPGSWLDPEKQKTIKSLTTKVPDALWGVQLALVLHAASREPGM